VCVCERERERVREKCEAKGGESTPPRGKIQTLLYCPSLIFVNKLFSVTIHPPTTQYYPFLAASNQTF